MAFDDPCQTGHDGEIILRGDGQRGGEIEFPDREVGAVGHQGVGDRSQGRLKILKINRSQRFLDVEFARFAVKSMTVPVKDTVGGVAVLLNLDDHKALPNGMEPAARNENALSCLGRGAVQGLLDITLFEGSFKGLSRHSLLQSGINDSTGGCMKKIPAFRLCFPAQLESLGDGGVYLNRKSFARIKQLDEQGKTWGGIIVVSCSEDFQTMTAPEFVECFSLQWPFMNDTLGFGAIDHFPEFPDRCAMGNGFTKQGFEAMSTPDTFHGERFKQDRFCKSHWWRIPFIR